MAADLRGIVAITIEHRAWQARSPGSIPDMSELSTRSTALYEKVTQLREHL
jgi:hypothetical protein